MDSNLPTTTNAKPVDAVDTIDVDMHVIDLTPPTIPPHPTVVEINSVGSSDASDASDDNSTEIINTCPEIVVEACLNENEELCKDSGSTDSQDNEKIPKAHTVSSTTIPVIKPPMYRSKRVLVLTFICLMVTIVAIATVLPLVLLKKPSKSFDESRGELSNITYLEQKVKELEIDHNSVAFNLAFSWLKQDERSLRYANRVESGKSLSKEDENFINIEQRFTAVLFYYEMSGDDWLACSNKGSNNGENCTLAFVEEEDKTTSIGTPWLSSYDECEWGGIICVDNLVNTLFLAQNGLNGTLPPSVSYFKTLERLYLPQNSIRGTIPREIGTISTLLAIQLQNNSLSGEIPSDIYSLNRLEVLFLSLNYLSGEIDSIGKNWIELRSLNLKNNQFSGNLSKIGLLTNLEILSLSDNDFEGSLPPSIENLESLEELHLSNNRLTGILSLPNSYNLGIIDIQNNFFSGPLLESFYSLRKMKVFIGRNNTFSGNLTNRIGNLKSAKYLFFEKNNFSGKIPMGFSQLKNLETLRLQENSFTGKFPNTICWLRITDLYVDCGSQGNDSPEVSCKCCCCISSSSKMWNCSNATGRD